MSAPDDDVSPLGGRQIVGGHLRVDRHGYWKVTAAMLAGCLFPFVVGGRAA